MVVVCVCVCAAERDSLMRSRVQKNQNYKDQSTESDTSDENTIKHKDKHDHEDERKNEDERVQTSISNTIGETQACVLFPSFVYEQEQHGNMRCA